MNVAWPVVALSIAAFAVPATAESDSGIGLDDVAPESHCQVICQVANQACTLARALVGSSLAGPICVATGVLVLVDSMMPGNHSP